MLISTDKAVRPKNMMGASKRLAEQVDPGPGQAGPKSGVGDTIYSMVRFGNVIGSSGSVIPLFQEQIARGGPVTLTHKDVTRYFMTIGEAARLVLVSAALRKGGDVFVLDMGDPMPIWSLAQQMIEAAGCACATQGQPRRRHRDRADRPARRRKAARGTADRQRPDNRRRTPRS
jgi:FlaA1/EpsC-like NDP-sugar epimerase